MATLEDGNHHTAYHKATVFSRLLDIFLLDTGLCFWGDGLDQIPFFILK